MSGERLMALMSASCRMPRNGTGQWMKPIQRRYSDSERPDWSFRTISAFNGRDVFDHAASPWKPVSSTVPTSRCSAPLKYTSSPLASDAIKGTSARATLRHRSRSTTCAPRPSRAAISSPLSDAPPRERSTVIAVANPAARARERRAVSQQPFPDRPEVLEVARIERIDGCSSDGEQGGQRIGHPNAVGRFQRLQPVHGRRGGYERRAGAAYAASRPEYHVGPVEGAGVVGPRPDRFAEPIGCDLDAVAVEHLDRALEREAPGEPGERGPVGDPRIREVHGGGWCLEGYGREPLAGEGQGRVIRAFAKAEDMVGHAPQEPEAVTRVDHQEGERQREGTRQALLAGHPEAAP